MKVVKESSALRNRKFKPQEPGHGVKEAGSIRTKRLHGFTALEEKAGLGDKCLGNRGLSVFLGRGKVPAREDHPGKGRKLKAQCV